MSTNTSNALVTTVAPLPLAQKPRPDAKLKILPEERQGEISEYAQTHSLAETVQWLEANGVETNSGTLSRFLCWQRFRQQMGRNEATVEELLGTVAEQNSDVSLERIQRLGQVFFASLALAKQDPRAWSLVQQAALRRAKLEFEMQKYNDAKLGGDLSQAPGGMTPETVAKIERELHLR